MGPADEGAGVSEQVSRLENFGYAGKDRDQSLVCLKNQLYLGL